MQARDRDRALKRATSAEGGESSMSSSSGDDERLHCRSWRRRAVRRQRHALLQQPEPQWISGCKCVCVSERKRGSARSRAAPAISLLSPVSLLGLLPLLPLLSRACIARQRQLPLLARLATSLRSLLLSLSIPFSRAPLSLSPSASLVAFLTKHLLIPVAAHTLPPSTRASACSRRCRRTAPTCTNLHLHSFPQGTRQQVSGQQGHRLRRRC